MPQLPCSTFNLLQQICCWSQNWAPSLFAKKDLLQNAPKKAPSMLQSTQLHRAPPYPPPTRSFPALHEHEGESVRQRERLVTKLARSHNHPHHIDSNHTLFGTPTKIRRSAHFLAFNLVQQYAMHVAAIRYVKHNKKLCVEIDAIGVPLFFDNMSCVWL